MDCPERILTSLLSKVSQKRLPSEFRTSSLLNSLSAKRLLALLLLSFLSFCKVETYNPAVPYSKAWWETTFLCFAMGQCGSPSTVVVENVPSSGTFLLETGFLVGTTQSDVEVSVDGGSFQPAQGSTTWSFALPTGSAMWRPKSVHTIQVRNVGSISGPSFTVRKGTNRDLNGDGYPDLIVGNPDAASNAGEIYVFYNTPKTGIAASISGEADLVLSGSAASDRFGAVFRLADTNADGYGDIVLGVEGYSASTGRVYIYQSAGKAGINAASFTTIDGPGTGAGFGHSIDLGDPNGNGFLDLVVGSPGYPSSTGTVYLYESTEDGFTDGEGGTSLTTAHADSFITGPTATNNNFGSGVAFGDFDGNGYSDLSIGGSLCDGQRGGGWVFLSSGTSGLITPNSLHSDASRVIAGVYYFGRFGESILTEDFNRDGYEDLVIGGMGFPSNGSAPTYMGKFSVFFGTASGIIAIESTAANFSVYSTDETADATSDTNYFLTSSMASGDLNGDGFPDLVVGARGYILNKGATYIIYGPATSFSGFILSPNVSNIIYGDSEQASQFGAGALAMDMDADGKSELFIGTPSDSVGGKTYIFKGSASLFGITNVVSIPNTSIVGGNGFGGSL